MGDDGLGGRLGGDPDHRADLLDGAGLEADVGDAAVFSSSMRSTASSSLGYRR